MIDKPALKDNQSVLTLEGEILGAIVRTNRKTKPIVVSIGHMISLESAIEIVRHCTRKSRIPEPLLEAHRKAVEKRNEIKKQINSN